MVRSRYGFLGPASKGDFLRASSHFEADFSIIKNRSRRKAGVKEIFMALGSRQGEL
jgi:hypothetical protein